MDDKRRIPYNIWICVLSVIIFLVIGSVGGFIVSIGINADQRAVKSKEYCTYNCWNQYTYKYDYNIETRSDWRDWWCRALMELLGGGVVILGIIVGVGYGSNRWWDKGEKSHKLKK